LLSGVRQLALKSKAVQNDDGLEPQAQEVRMPEEKTIERAQRDKEEGKSPSTQAGEFIREEMHHIREGKHGARSPQQAIAIGLSKARRVSNCPRRKAEPQPKQRPKPSETRKKEKLLRIGSHRAYVRMRLSAPSSVSRDPLPLAPTFPSTLGL
jgi:hypothetical protein